jgi:glutamine synthetase
LKPVDASSNPYLALGAVIAAGMNGIWEKMHLPEPVQKDPSALSSVEMDKLGVNLLPQNMKEAFDNLKENKPLLDAFGAELSKSYMAVKNTEYEELRKLPSEKKVDLLLEKY